MTSKFRNSTNTRYTKALFLELNYGTDPENQEAAIYTLSREDKEYNGKKYLSLYKLYMAENDILEHDFANKYFEDWEHWQMISKTSWMKPLIEAWREELEIRIRSDALKLIQSEAYAGTKYSYAAAVYLARQGWKDKPKTEELAKKKGAGRPSKAQIAEEAARIAMEEHDVDADLKRLGLN